MTLPDFGQDFGVLLKSLGSKMPRQRFQRGTLRKIGKRRKMWLGRYQVYVRLEDGQEKRRDRTLVLGPATLTKTEAQAILDREISRSTGQSSGGGLPPNPTFEQLWDRYADLKASTWGTSTAKTVRAVFSGKSKSKKHPCILSIIGGRRVMDLTFDPLQTLLNHVATRGESLSTLKTVRTYLAAALEYAVSERVILSNPARNLELPTKLLTKKPSERFYSIEEIQRLLTIATGQEHLALSLLFACGLRPQELLALRDDDIEPGVLRVDEGVKEKERGANRIGSTKSFTSTGFVYLPDSIYREIQAWQMSRIQAFSPAGSPFLFPTERGTAHRIGNFLKRNLQPIAKRAGITDFTFQACRRSCATHFQQHGSPKDTQAHLRHADLTMTGKYMKQISPLVAQAVENMLAEMTVTDQGKTIQ